MVMPDTKFSTAIAVILKNEGSEYTDIPEDKGGPTRWGIIGTDLEDAINKKIVPRYTTIKGLTVDQAKAIYKELYYDNCSNLAKIDSQDVITKILDLRVNIGTHGATKMVQRALNSLGSYCIAEDGIFGPRTLEAVNSTKPAFLLTEIRKFQKKYYNNIVIHNHKQSVFLNGWLRRVDSC